MHFTLTPSTPGVLQKEHWLEQEQMTQLGVAETQWQLPPILLPKVMALLPAPPLPPLPHPLRSASLTSYSLQWPRLLGPPKLKLYLHLPKPWEGEAQVGAKLRLPGPKLT